MTWAFTSSIYFKSTALKNMCYCFITQCSQVEKLVHLKLCLLLQKMCHLGKSECCEILVQQQKIICLQTSFLYFVLFTISVMVFQRSSVSLSSLSIILHELSMNSRQIYLHVPVCHGVSGRLKNSFNQL